MASFRINESCVRERRLTRSVWICSISSPPRGHRRVRMQQQSGCMGEGRHTVACANCRVPGDESEINEPRWPVTGRGGPARLQHAPSRHADTQQTSSRNVQTLFAPRVNRVCHRSTPPGCHCSFALRRCRFVTTDLRAVQRDGVSRAMPPGCRSPREQLGSTDSVLLVVGSACSHTLRNANDLSAHVRRSTSRPAAGPLHSPTLRSVASEIYMSYRLQRSR